jgi:hypothetical protein
MDTVGSIYAPTANLAWSGVFRLSAVLNQCVDADLLQQALDDIMTRFPYFRVNLKQGVFWHYLEESSNRLVVQSDCHYPCQPFAMYHKQDLMRILYSKHRISVEFFHGLTDGGGGWIFVKTLLRRYLELSGVSISGYQGCINWRERPKLHESANAYNIVYNPSKGINTRSTPKAWKLELPQALGNVYYLTHFELEYNRLKYTARQHNCNVNELMLSLIVYTLICLKRCSHTNNTKQIIVNVSYDLRRKFGIMSMRNFFGYALFDIQDTLTFDSVIKQVQTNLHKVDKDYLIKCINTNVMAHDSWIAKIMPLIWKQPILNIGYKLYGEKLASISYSNYGQAIVPKEFGNHIDRLESSNGVAKSGRLIEASTITFGNKTVLTICVKSESVVLEQQLAQLLNILDLTPKVSSNRYC